MSITISYLSLDSDGGLSAFLADRRLLVPVVEMFSYSKSSVRVETRDRFFGSESSEFSSSEPLYQRRFLADKPRKRIGNSKNPFLIAYAL